MSSDELLAEVTRIIIDLDKAAHVGPAAEESAAWAKLRNHLYKTDAARAYFKVQADREREREKK